MADRAQANGHAHGPAAGDGPIAFSTGDERFVALVAELVRREQQQPLDRVTLHLGPYTAFVLVGALQLAWRHPGHGAKLRAIIEQLARNVQSSFTPEYFQLLEMGWNPAHDVERGE